MITRVINLKKKKQCVLNSDYIIVYVYIICHAGLLAVARVLMHCLSVQCWLIIWFHARVYT